MLVSHLSRLTYSGANEAVALGTQDLQIFVQLVITLMKITNQYAEAYNDMIQFYGRMGELLPLLQKFEKILHDTTDLIRAVYLLYEDILKFHRTALEYFQRPS